MITANVTVMFEADTADAVTAVVGAWEIPEGGSVHVITTEQLMSGTIVDGVVTPPAPPEEVQSGAPVNGAGTEQM